MKLVLTNKTDWRSDDLRKIIIAGLKHEGVWTPRGHYYVRVTYGRRGPCSTGGYGYYHRPEFSLHPPKRSDVEEMSPSMVIDLARVIMHEVGHNKGMMHDEMAALRDLDTTWCSGMRVRRRVPRRVTTDERVEARANKVNAKIEEIESKLELMKAREKRLRKRLTHWRRKQRYYTKRAARPRD